jgi:hypothetical protein
MQYRPTSQHTSSVTAFSIISFSDCHNHKIKESINEDVYANNERPEKARNILYNVSLVTCEPGWNLYITMPQVPGHSSKTYIPLSVTLITFNKLKKDNDFYSYKEGICL